MTNSKLLYLLFGFLLMGPVLRSQPFTLDPRIKPVELKLMDYKKPREPKPNGRMGHKVFTQQADTAYYFVKGLSMYSPTYLSINSTNPGADLEVKLCQENWKLFHQVARIAGKELWSTNFKTEGDFGIMVIARQTPVRYVLLAWSGKELKIELPSVFNGPETAGTGSDGWLKKNAVLMGVILAAALIIVVLVYKLKTKKA